MSICSAGRIGWHMTARNRLVDSYRITALPQVAAILYYSITACCRCCFAVSGLCSVRVRVSRRQWPQYSLTACCARCCFAVSCECSVRARVSRWQSKDMGSGWVVLVSEAQWGYTHEHMTTPTGSLHMKTHQKKSKRERDKKMRGAGEGEREHVGGRGRGRKIYT